jgi:hypothetical protein
MASRAVGLVMDLVKYRARPVPAHYPCRVRAGTACWGFGSHTTLCRVRAGTDTKPIMPCRVRVVFLVSCPVQ